MRRPATPPTSRSSSGRTATSESVGTSVSSSCKTLAQVAGKAPVVGNDLSQFVQGGAETKQGEQPPRTAGVGRQCQLGGEDVSLAAGREVVEEEQQRVRQQRTKVRVRRRQQLAEAQQYSQQAVVGIV
jgi:hypothetical protein